MEGRQIIRAFVVLIVRLSILLFSADLHAAPAEDNGGVDEEAGPTQLIELKPLLTWSDEGAPADLGLALGYERRLEGRWVVTGEVGGWGVSRRDSHVEDLARGEAASDPIVRNRLGGAVLGGVRRYGKVSGSTWYAGVKSGFMTVETTYVVDGIKVDEVAAGIPLSFEGGYRWLGDRFSLRIGGRSGPVAYTRRDIVVAEAGGAGAAARDRIREDEPDFLPALEVAFGYAW